MLQREPLTTLVEARSADRARTFLRAQIRFNNNNSTVDCTIKNMSGTGAKIELSNSITVPAEFTLDIPAKAQLLRARIIWRDADGIGVDFIEPVAGAEPIMNDMARLERELRKLKTVNAILTKRLEDLGQDVSIQTY